MSRLLGDHRPAPPHRAHLDRVNRRGPGTPRPARSVTADQVTDAVLSGAWVIDLRARDAFAAGHLPGSLSVAYDDRHFAAHVGYLVPWDDDIVLLTDTPELLGPALRDLAEVGIDGAGAHVLGSTGSRTASGGPLTAHLRRADWTAFARARSTASPVVVDVRDLDEFEAGHLPGAVHLALHEVEPAAATLPPGEVWVHCRSGYRAGIAASLLQRAGRDVVHVDDAWERLTDLDIVVAA